MIARNKKIEIGFIGLGNIGLPASINLMRSGFSVKGYDLHPNRQFADAGGQQVNSLKEIAECDVIIQSLPTAGALQQTLEGLEGYLRRGHVIIDLSSYDLTVKRAAADRLLKGGVTMLDCEISGIPPQVINRTAVIFKAGDESVIEAQSDIFDALADKHLYLGEFGAATKMKLIANLMVCVHNTIAAEAVSLGMAAGLEADTVIKAIGSSAAGSITFNNKAPVMAGGQFDNGVGPFRHMFGYLRRIADFAKQSGREHAMPMFDATRAVFDRAEDAGRHDQDIAAVIEVLDEMQKEMSR